VAGFVLLT